MDWNKFRHFLQKEFAVTQAYMFIGYMEGYQQMYEQLSGYGYTVIFKPTVAFETKDQQVTVTKGNVDVELVLQVMKDYEQYDQAVVVSADGDFYSLIKYLLQQGKLRTLIVPSQKYSNLLREFDANITHINQYQDELIHQPLRPKTSLGPIKRPPKKRPSTPKSSSPKRRQRRPANES